MNTKHWKLRLIAFAVQTLDKLVVNVPLLLWAFVYGFGLHQGCTHLPKELVLRFVVVFSAFVWVPWMLACWWWQCREMSRLMREVTQSTMTVRLTCVGVLCKHMRRLSDIDRVAQLAKLRDSDPELASMIEKGLKLQKDEA